MMERIHSIEVINGSEFKYTEYDRSATTISNYSEKKLFTVRDLREVLDNFSDDTEFEVDFSSGRGEYSDVVSITFNAREEVG